MKTRLTIALLAAAVLLLIASCSKPIDIMPLPQPPGNVDTASYVQFSAIGVQQSNIQLYALLSIETKTGQAVFTNKKITLDQIQEVYKTDKLPLAKGAYKLTKFIIVKTSDTALYAIPKVNTAKAAQSPNPLPVYLTIAQKGVSNAALEVLKINDADAAENYGYTNDDFGKHAFVTVRVKLKINAGQVVYDNLPGKLLIDAASNDGTHWIREVELTKGINSIRVPEQYSTFKFAVAKWNTTAQKIVSRSALQENMLIALEGTREPKRLIKEESFIENSSGFVADSRTEYFYNSNSRLAEIKNYQKSTTTSGLILTNVYKFIYTGNRLDSIKRYDGANASTGYTAFTYDFGRIQTIVTKSYAQQTSAFIEYTGTGENEVISGDYSFHNGNTMNYKIFVANGNKISDEAQSSRGGSETGVYEYDDNINPKHQLGWDDLFFSNYSKNNLKEQQKNYTGGFPENAPYKFEYVYDNHGYPSEVYISYKGYSSGEHLFRIKKVYQYQ